jgi:hypothetical protein
MPRPTLIEALGPIIAQYSREQLPVFAAAAERLAAERYRHWARLVAGDSARAALIDCAEREEEIARRVSALHEGSAALQEQIAADHPDLRERYWTIFEGLELAEQFAAQAAAERTGAETWRAFAAECADTAAEPEYLACATLEEQSAATLDRLITQGADS